MDMFTGRKIGELRKYSSLSQEALAEKLGVSRQAISKWERGEASPDTDNFVALAEIFGITVDELLGDKKAHELFDFEKKAKEQPTVAEPPENPVVEGNATASQPLAAAADKAEDKGKLHKHGKKKSKPDDKKFMPEVKLAMNKIPVFIIVPTVYILCGLAFKLWHPTWFMFFIIPIYYLTAFAFNAKNKRGFFLRLPIWLGVIVVYLLFGFLGKLWHPMWIIFLAVPIYYWTVYHMKKD